MSQAYCCHSHENGWWLSESECIVSKKEVSNMKIKKQGRKKKTYYIPRDVVQHLLGILLVTLLILPSPLVIVETGKLLSVVVRTRSSLVYM